MKKAIFIASATAMLCACGGSDSYTITGQLQDCDSGMVWLVSDGQAIDSVSTADGRFSFTGKTVTPQMAYIYDNWNQNSLPLCKVVLEPGMLQIRKTDLDYPFEYTCSGSVSNELITQYSITDARWEEEFTRYEDNPQATDSLQKSYLAMGLQLIRENHDNMFGLFLISSFQYYLTPTEIMTELNGFSGPAKSSVYFKDLYMTTEKKMKREVGQPYIDFIQPTVDGISLSAKDVISNPSNKYVLIDFWASWCAPCLAEVPYLKETYDEFSSKGFEILGISLDQDRESWLSAISQYEMEWIQVCDLKFMNNSAVEAYTVIGIPANYLIDCGTGKIIAANLRGEELKEKITDLLK